MEYINNIERHGVFYLHLSWEDYHKMINPKEIFINKEQRPKVLVGDLQDMFSSVEVFRNNYLTSGEKLVLKKKGSNIWGEIDDQIVGYISLVGGNEEDLMGENSIELVVAEEYQGKGIGTKLLLEFRKDFPFKQTGGLTEAGIKVEKKVFRYLQHRLNQQRLGL